MLKQEKKIVRAPAGSLWKTIYKTAEQKQLSFWGWTNINIGNTSLFGKLLKIDNSVSVHHRTNIKVLSTELVYKLVNGLSPKLINDCLKRGTLFYPGWLTKSYMTLNHSLTWDQRFGKLCSLTWKINCTGNQLNSFLYEGNTGT